MRDRVRSVWVVVATVAVIWGANATSAFANEKQLVSCRVQKVLSSHEFEEGLDTRHNMIVDLFRNSHGSKPKLILQLGGFQDFDTYRGDQIVFKQTSTADIVVARYQEFKWIVQIAVSKSLKGGMKSGVLTYREDPASKPVHVADLGCK